MIGERQGTVARRNRSTKKTSQKTPGKVVDVSSESLTANKKSTSARRAMQRKRSIQNEAQTLVPDEAPPGGGTPARKFPIVGIGASAGGLEAIEELLENLTADSGMAFVIITHQLPGHTSMLPELLARKTDMPVMEATEGLQVKPNNVYVGPPDGRLAILNGTLHRLETGKEPAPKLPIDFFFRSLAEDQQERAICIILSGTGSDGTLGLKSIKGESGMAMVEQPQAAKYSGMPASAIATGLADYVLPPAAMPAQLIAYVQGPYLKAAAVAAELPTVPAEPLQKIYILLRSRTGNDFSSYKSSTLHRRIERRMNVHQIKDPNQYVRYLQETPHEIDTLFKELLISVTSFFRDPAAWDALSHPLEELVRLRPDNSTLRVWVPGCATGEEVFSIAILLRECLDNAHRPLGVQIFGSDLDAAAIETARIGRYPEGIAGDVPPPRLERFFLRDDGSYRIRKEIRDLAIFAPQNVIKDPPFTKLDLISCRNLLIYLNSDLQKKLLPIFHYALKPDGLLFLGPSETVGSFTDLFEPLDKRWKIFRRKEGALNINPLLEMPAQPVAAEKFASNAASPVSNSRQVHFATVIEHLLLGRFTPASVVVNARGDILYIHGRTGAYLEPSQGQPRNNLLEMARDGLQIELAAAMRQCVSKGTEVVAENVRVKTDGQIIYVNLGVAPLRDPESVRGLLLVTFRPSSPAPEKTTKTRKSSGGKDRFEQLERELQHMRESHQATLEELEMSNEELKSTNEELQSTNEELQSTNEELETSKEEMQSLNEELTTVNAELQTKVEDLSQANDDMQNLLNSTDIATVFLDNDLNIKRFTEQSKKLVMLRPTDVGRPISELAISLEQNDLAADCQRVLQTLIFKESEVRTRDGVNYLMRILPYRTAENAIDGLVLTFVDINRLKLAESAKREVELSRTFFESIVQTIPHPLMVLDEALRVVAVNEAFCVTFHTTRQETEGQLIYDLGNRQWDIAELRELLENILPRNSPFNGFLVEHEFPKVGQLAFMLNACRLEHAPNLPSLILLSLDEVTKK